MPALKNRWVRIIAFIAVLGCAITTAPGAVAKPEMDNEGLKPILSYISSAWDTLTRSMTQCDSVVDPKLAAQSVLYLPAEFRTPAAVQKLQQDCKIDIEHLPVAVQRPGQVDPRKISPPGLLFLE